MVMSLLCWLNFGISQSLETQKSEILTHANIYSNEYTQRYSVKLLFQYKYKMIKVHSKGHGGRWGCGLVGV